MYLLSRLILKLWGWKTTGEDDIRHLPKKLFAVVPHTSNWDFLLGILVRHSCRLRTYYLGKKSLFRFPYGIIFRSLGGYPVDRSQHNNLVDAIVDLFNRHETFGVTIAPEGTRKKVTSLKTGFYYIALRAQIPIILTKFDGQNKIVEFSKPFWPTGQIEKDMAIIESHFDGILGIVPENSFFAQQ